MGLFYINNLKIYQSYVKTIQCVNLLKVLFIVNINLKKLNRAGICDTYTFIGTVVIFANT